MNLSTSVHFQNSNDHAIPGMDTDFIKRSLQRIGFAFHLRRKNHFLPGLFCQDTFGIVNGVAYNILLFTSDECLRLIPTSCSIFPQAFIQHCYMRAFHFPSPGSPYNPLQQLSYFVVVFFTCSFHDCNRCGNVTINRC